MRKLLCLVIFFCSDFTLAGEEWVDIRVAQDSLVLDCSADLKLDPTSGQITIKPGFAKKTDLPPGKALFLQESCSDGVLVRAYSIQDENFQLVVDGNQVFVSRGNVDTRVGCTVQRAICSDE